MTKSYKASFFYFLIILPFIPAALAVGLFSECDPVFFWLCFTAGLLAILIGLGEPKYRCVPPVSFGFFLMAAVSMPGIFQNFLTTLGGSNEIREGTALFLALAINFSYAKKLNFPGLPIWIVPIFYALLTIAGHYGWIYIGWKTYIFLDIAAFALLASVPMYINFRKTLNESAALWDATYIACFSFLIFYSDNSAATLACLCAAIFVYVLPIAKKYHRFLRRKDGFYIVLGIISITATVLLSWFFFNAIPSQLQSRTMLGVVTILQYFDHFNFTKLLHLLFGYGWGSFQEFPVLNLFRLENFGMYESGSFQPTWEYINRNLLHSHNFFLETLLSSGLIGAGILLTMIYKWVNTIDKTDLAGRFFVVSYLILLTAWFQTPPVLIFCFLALVLVKENSREYHIPKFIWLSCGVFLMVFSCLELWSSISMTKHRFQSIQTFEEDIERFINDPAHNYDKFCSYKASNLIISNFSFELSKFSVNEALFFASIERAVIKTAKDYLDSRQKYNILSSIAIINFCHNYIALPGVTVSADCEFFKIFKKVLMLHIENFPERADMSIGFFVFCFDKIRDLKQVNSMADNVLATNPNHPVGLWFKGLAGLSLGGAKKQSLEKMQKAVKLGLQRYMPVDKTILKAIGIQ